MAPRSTRLPALLGVRQQQKQRTRQALLAAAKKVLARRGFTQTTTREIASEAQVAAGTFFVHFPDVSALVAALVDEHISSTLEVALRTAPRKPGLVAQLVHVSRVLYESYDAAPELSRAYVSGSLFVPEPGKMSARLATFHGWVSQRIDQAIVTGEIPEVDRELAFTGFFSIYFGLLVAGLNGLVSRKRQLSMLQSALTRLFLLREAA